jgi:hypothetical protein
LSLRNAVFVWSWISVAFCQFWWSLVASKSLEVRRYITRKSYWKRQRKYRTTGAPIIPVLQRKFLHSGWYNTRVTTREARHYCKSSKIKGSKVYQSIPSQQRNVSITLPQTAKNL